MDFQNIIPTDILIELEVDMHQSHNIPWHIIEANFKFVTENKAIMNFRPGYFPKDNPRHNITKDLQHFIAKFVSTIRTFAETERIKYPKRIAPLTSGKIFPDALREKHPVYLNERNQRIEFWVRCFQDQYGDWWTIQPVINVLLYENEMEGLIMLAQHPQIDLRHRMLWREQEMWYQYGFNRTKELSLSAYMFFCTAQAMGTLESGKYTLDGAYRRLVEQMAHFQERSSEQVTHLELLRDIGVDSNTDPQEIFVHKDHERFQKYLKDLFALLYRYDMFARECGIDPEWEKELSECYPLFRHVPSRFTE